MLKEVMEEEIGGREGNEDKKTNVYCFNIMTIRMMSRVT
jgi:hypothetical protein